MTMYTDENEETDEEVVVEVLPPGENPDELYSEREEQTLVIVHKGKTWTFKYHDLNFKEKYDCIDESVSMGGDEFGFSMGTYYIACLKKMLIRSPIPITETTIGNLAGPVSAQLIGIVPPPTDEAAVVSLKKA